MQNCLILLSNYVYRVACLFCHWFGSSWAFWCKVSLPGMLNSCNGINPEWLHIIAWGPGHMGGILGSSKQIWHTVVWYFIVVLATKLWKRILSLYPRNGLQLPTSHNILCKYIFNGTSEWLGISSSLLWCVSRMVMFYLLVQAEVAEGIGGQCVPIVIQSRGGKKGDTDCTLPMSWDHLGI